MVEMGCADCLGSTAYSCLSKVSLTVAAVLKVIISIAIIVIVAIKFEDVKIEVAGVDGLADLASQLINGSPPSPPPSPTTSLTNNTDLNTNAGPVSVQAACLLRRSGTQRQLETLSDLIDIGGSRTMCQYAYAVCAISLFACLVMALLLWCTCRLCGCAPAVELLFALLGVVWWLAAAVILMRHTTVDANTQPGGVQVAGSLPSPPPPPPPPFPPPPLAPGANSTDGTGAGGAGGDQDLGQQLGDFVQALVPHSLPQWRQALVVMAWVTMGLFALEALLLSVEVCGCLADCCGCFTRCCCCPDRPESRWRARSRNAKARRAGSGDEYVEMCDMPNSTPSSITSPAGVSGKAPRVVVVARSDSQVSAAAGGKGSGRGWSLWGKGGK